MNDENTKLVVIDTNVWVYRTSLLSSTIASSFLMLAQTNHFKIGLPEVIENEIQSNFFKTIEEQITEITQTTSRLSAVMGSKFNPSLPKPAQVNSRLNSRYFELRHLIRRLPFTLEHATNSLIRVQKGTPPNSAKNQQFKDSAIWEAILSVSDEYTPVLITEDKAFFQDRTVSKGLATNLKNDRNVEIHFGLEPFLREYGDTAKPLAEKSVIDSIDKSLRNVKALNVEDWPISLAELEAPNVVFYLSPDENMLSVFFSFKYQGHSHDTFFKPGLREAEIKIIGSCGFNLKSQLISEIYLDSWECKFEQGSASHEFNDSRDFTSSTPLWSSLDQTSQI